MDVSDDKSECLQHMRDKEVPGRTVNLTKYAGHFYFPVDRKKKAFISVTVNLLIALEKF